MKRLLYVISLSALIAAPLKAEGYDNWKAPPPVAPRVTTVPAPVRELAPHQVLVNEVVDEERLPYVKVLHYDLKIAISPEVLERYNLKSGDSVPKTLMDDIIESDRAFQKGVLR